jgi:hypothetical protein
MAFADALRVLNTMKADGVIREYAVAGGLAIVFWTEPVATYDLDVLVFLPPGAGPLVSLESVYRWASAHGYVADMEHILIECRHNFCPLHLSSLTKRSRPRRRLTTKGSLQEWCYLNTSSRSTFSLRHGRPSAASAPQCYWSGAA